MPADAKPLFRLDALRAKMSLYSMAPAILNARPKLGNWTDLLASKAAEKMKETELLADFIRDVFGDLLGYDGPASGKPVYTAEQQSGRRSMLDWLKLEFGIEKPSQRLQDVARLDADGLAGEVRKARGRTKPLTVADMMRVKTEHAVTVTPLQTLAAEALGLERTVSDLVNAAYGLTPKGIALMWAAAPPRMPLAGPGN